MVIKVDNSLSKAGLNISQVGADKGAKDEVWNNKRINNGSVYFNWEDYEPIKFKYGKSVLVENSGVNKKS